MYKTTKRIKKARKAHTCQICRHTIGKGKVYYRTKEFYPPYDESDKPFSYETSVCPKCKYREGRSRERFARFKEHCPHKVTATMYRYIPGECVQEPDYDICLICGKRL